MKSFKFLDTVRSVKELDKVPLGSRGTIVHMHSEGSYEVEFFVNNTSVVSTVTNDKIKKS